MRADLRRGPAAAALVLLLVGCTDGPPPTRDGSTWEGSITHEDGLTRVVNRTGSLWQGRARLREEVSLGAAEGAEPYLFGQVVDVWAGPERLYVVDAQLPAVRVYDLEGRHLLDVGTEGQGPGEFREPISIAVRDDGEIVVAEAGPRVHRYGPDGTHRETLDTGAAWHVFTDGLQLGLDGTLFKVTVDPESLESPRGRLPRLGWRPIGGTASDPTAGEPTFPPAPTTPDECLSYAAGRQRWCGLPWATHTITAFTPAGDWVVAHNESYRFEVHRAAGGRLEVVRDWSPVPVPPGQREYERDRIRTHLRSLDPQWTWNGPDVATHKPPFDRIVPDRSGRLWLRREGASVERQGECTRDFERAGATGGYVSCWSAGHSWDVFGPDGRLLGSVREPDGAPFALAPFVRDDLLVVAVHDEQGVARVKRYRLEIPAASEATASGR